MKFSTVSLILVCFCVLTFSKPAPPQVDKLSYIIDALTKPYTDALENMRTNTAANYQRLQSLLTSGLSSTDEEPKPKKVLKDANLNNEDFAADEEEEAEGNSRMLQSITCSSVSSQVSASVNIFNCSGSIVSRTDYDNLKGENCTITTETKSLCYCPYDYYGDRCQIMNQFTCDIERISHPLDCEGVDSFTYVYSYSGIPPCHTVEVGQIVNFRDKLICRPTNSQYDFEGIKHSKYEVITQPTAPTTFTYDISNERLHITDATSPVNHSILFTNWRKMSEMILFDTILTIPQIAGEDEIVTTFEFSGNLSKAATTGRYYFEISLITTGLPAFQARTYNGGYFEQAGYQEPPAPAKANKALIIALSVVGAVLVVGIIVGYKLYQRKKLQKEKDNVDMAPLVADQ